MSDLNADKLYQLLMFVGKVLQMCQKQLTFPHSMHNALQTQCSFENMPINSIGNVSIVSYVCAQIINYINTLTKLTLMHTCIFGVSW